MKSFLEMIKRLKDLKDKLKDGDSKGNEHLFETEIIAEITNKCRKSNCP